MVSIVPAILAKTKEQFVEDLRKVWGHTRRVQLDVCDGVMVPNKTVMPEVLTEVDTIVDFDIHLMVDSPENWVERCAESGAIGVYGQVEMMKDTTKFVADAQVMGMKVGLAYKLGTPFDGLMSILHDLDAVLLMSVEPGAQGGDFDIEVLKRIKDLRRMSRHIKIIVDGGLNVDNIIKTLGAEWAAEMELDELDRSFIDMEFVVGSAIMKAADPLEELKRLEHLRN
jgi:ribulose-phosphate 3-epimerase